MKTQIMIISCMLACSAVSAQESKSVQPSPKVIVDNSNVKVTQFESQPGKDVCGIGSHSHEAHLTVLLTDATVTVSLPNGKTATHRMPAGTTFWSVAETHTVINSGSEVAKAQIIEYRKK